MLLTGGSDLATHAKAGACFIETVTSCFEMAQIWTMRSPGTTTADYILTSPLEGLITACYNTFCSTTNS
jgi:hypothetical protein